MDIQVLRPVHDALEIKGKISYNEGAQAWNIIRFKKELLQEFPQLKEKRSQISYKMLIFQTYKDLEKAIKDVKEQDAFPILLFFYKTPLNDSY